MIKQSGNTYNDGFNDGVLCAWEEYSHLIDNFLDEAAENGISIDYELESFLTNLISNVKEASENEVIERFSDKAVDRLEKF